MLALLGSVPWPVLGELGQAEGFACLEGNLGFLVSQHQVPGKGEKGTGTGSDTQPLFPRCAPDLWEKLPPPLSLDFVHLAERRKVLIFNAPFSGPGHDTVTSPRSVPSPVLLSSLLLSPTAVAAAWTIFLGVAFASKSPPACWAGGWGAPFSS